MRVFLAIELPEPLKVAVADRLTGVAPRLPRARYTPAGNLHLTLHFFGERTSERVGQIAEALAPAIGSHAPFAIEVAPVGSFPSGQPRVIWLGIAPSPPLAALHAGVRRVLGELGEVVDSRPFHPHLTLARVQAPWRRSDLDTLRDALRELEGERVAVESVMIFESHLGREGAQHLPRLVMKLLGNERAAT
jgi:RNA 2',3'-cyclic 3'-phosphodiesterase